MTDSNAESVNKLIKEVSDIQQQYIIGSQSPSSLFSKILEIYLQYSDSEYGYIGRISDQGEGKFLDVLAVSEGISNFEYLSKHTHTVSEGLSFTNIGLLLSHATSTNSPVIHNRAPQDKVVDNIANFMCVPIYLSKQLLGLVVLGDNQRKYSAKTLSLIQPLVSCCSAILVGLSKSNPINELSEVHLTSSNLPYSSEQFTQTKQDAVQSYASNPPDQPPSLSERYKPSELIGEGVGLSVRDCLDAAIENGIVSMTLIDKNGRVVLADKNTIKQFKETAGLDLFPGQPYRELLPEQNIDSFEHYFSKALNGTSSFFKDTVNYDERGLYHLEIAYSPILNNDEQVSGVVISVCNITGKKKNQLALAKSKNNFDAILDATAHSYFLLDKEYNIVEFNTLAASAVKATHGVELCKGDNMLKFTDPKLAKDFEEKVHAAFDGEAGYVDAKVEHPNSEIWYNVQYLPVTNDAGKTYGVAFIARDITQDKMTELELAKSYLDAQSFRDTLYSSALVSVTDLNGTIIEVNEKFCKESCYTAEELIGKPHSIVNSGYHSPEFFGKMWKTITQGGVWRGDIKNKAKDGSYYWVDTSIHPIKDSEGNVDHYLSVRNLITNHKKAEEEIKEYASRLDEILESTTDGFFTLDREWRFTRVNSVLEKSLQRSREELVGMVVWDAFPEAVQLKFKTEYSKAMYQAEDVHFEEYFPPLDIWFEAHAYPNNDGISVFFRDISNRRKSEAEIKKLSLVASKTDNTVIITDAERKIEWVNEGFTKLTQYTPEEVIGKDPGHILQGPESDPETLRRISRNLTLNESIDEEVVNYRKNGEMYWVRMYINPIMDDEGKVSKYVSIQSDVTTKKNTEIERMHLVGELIRKNQSLEEYAFITSHNLRAPVAHIMGLTSLFNKKDMSDPFNQTVVKQLGKASENLDSIIKDITELLAIRNNDIKHKENMSVRSLVSLVLEGLQSQIDETDAKISFQATEHDELYTIKNFLHSVLLNLLSNAIKYRHPDRRPEINVTYKRTNEHSTITITDNGLGIDLEKYQHKIFNLYSRFHSHVEGKGMGLYIVKTLTEAMGGEIKVDSQVYKGSTFSIVLPV